MSLASKDQRRILVARLVYSKKHRVIVLTSCFWCPSTDKTDDVCVRDNNQITILYRSILNLAVACVVYLLIFMTDSHGSSTPSSNDHTDVIAFLLKINQSQRF